MLQFPTNFSPDGDVVHQNSTEYTVSFTFNGDAMFGVLFHVYDYKTGQLLESFSQYSNNYFPSHYNGDTFSLTHNIEGAGYTNLCDYIVQAMIMQGNRNGSENVCDMLATSGVVQETSSTSTNVIIEKDINCIYEWGLNNGVYYPTMNSSRIVAEMKIEINNEYHTITSYDPSTGIITIDQAFSSVSVTEGITYRIYANYLITPQYFLMCRATDVLYINSVRGITRDDSRMEVSVNGGSTSYVGDNRLEWYEYKLYWHWYSLGELSDEDVVATLEEIGTLIGKTGRVYRQHIDSTVLDAWRCPANYGMVGYGYFFPVVTIKNKYGGVYSTFSRIAVNSDTSHDPQVGALNVQFNHNRGALNSDGFSGVNFLEVDFTMESPVMVEDEEEVKIVALFRKQDWGDYEFISQATPSGGYVSLLDYSIPLNRTSEYVIMPTDLYGKVYSKGVKTFEVNSKSDAMSITGLKHQNNSPFFVPGSHWLFEVGIENPTISFNIGANPHIGYENYPTVSRFGIDYATGNVTTDLSYMSCPDRQYIDTLDMIKAWRTFISKYPMYMLKDLKGNVFFVQITDVPTVSWEEQNPMRPTTISFNWIEVKKPEEVTILGGVG